MRVRGNIKPILTIINQQTVLLLRDILLLSQEIISEFDMPLRNIQSGMRHVILYREVGKDTLDNFISLENTPAETFRAVVGIVGISFEASFLAYTCPALVCPAVPRTIKE
jgi:hypothetical protein